MKTHVHFSSGRSHSLVAFAFVGACVASPGDDPALGDASSQAADLSRAPAAWGVPDPAITLEDLVPFAPGAEWHYLDKSATKPEHELVKAMGGCSTLTKEDCVTGAAKTYDVAIQVTPGDPDEPEDGEDDTSYALTPDGLVRVVEAGVAKDGTVLRTDSYSPPFLRVIAPPYVPGRTVMVEHERCRCEGGTCGQSTLKFRHTVLGSATVTVPAGTFQAVVFERVNLISGERKRLWYAPGVGKVLEEELREDDVLLGSEALLSHEPGGTSCWTPER